MKDETKTRQRGATVALAVLGALWVLIYVAYVYLSEPLGVELAAGLALVAGLFAAAALSPVQDAYVNWVSRRARAKINHQRGDLAQVASEEEFLEDVRRGLRESVAYWASDKKVDREIYVVRTFLKQLGVQHAETEIESEASEPPDVNFRDARFEVKEILDHDRRRHEEYRKKLEKALAAQSVAELMEQYTPTDLTFGEIADHVLQLLKGLSKHYSPNVIKQLDLVIYVNLLKRWVVLDSPIPDSSRFSEFGWRSISVVRSSVACVFFARADAPTFILSHVGKPVSLVSE